MEFIQTNQKCHRRNVLTFPLKQRFCMHLIVRVILMIFWDLTPLFKFRLQWKCFYASNLRCSDFSVVFLNDHSFFCNWIGFIGMMYKLADVCVYLELEFNCKNMIILRFSWNYFFSSMLSSSFGLIPWVKCGKWFN